MKLYLRDAAIGILLGLVIEQVAGTSYPEAVQSRVFDPAGMTESGFFRLDEAVPNVATGYLPLTSPGAPRRTNIYSIPVIGGADATRPPRPPAAARASPVPEWESASR